MTETLFKRVRQWLHDLTAPADDTPDVDIEYITAGMEYKHLTTDLGDGLVRCDLCGMLFDAEEFPDVFDHLDSHDSQGDACINPFEQKEVVARMDYSDIEGGIDEGALADD